MKEITALQTLEFLRSVGGPQPSPGLMTDGLGSDFLHALLAAFPDREPTTEEIVAFERGYRAGRRP